MKIRPKLSNATLLVALAAVTATAWAATTYDSTWIPAPAVTQAPAQPVIVQTPPAVTTNEAIAREQIFAPGETLAPNETVVAPRPVARTRAPVVEDTVVETTVLQPPITIEQQRLTEDERIQAQVMDRLANAPNLSGKIGVESQDRIVTLSGYTMTAAQAWRAEREAGRVTGVRYVQNQLRARIGGSVL